MKKESLDKLVGDLESQWQEQIDDIIESENRAYIYDIELEFYESKCSDMGYSEDQIETVLQHMGY